MTSKKYIQLTCTSDADGNPTATLKEDDNGFVNSIAVTEKQDGTHVSISLSSTDPNSWFHTPATENVLVNDSTKFESQIAKKIKENCFSIGASGFTPPKP